MRRALVWSLMTAIIGIIGSVTCFAQYTESVSATLNNVTVPNQPVTENVTVSNQASYAMVQNGQDSLDQSNGYISFQFPSGVRALGTATGVGSCYAPATMTQNETQNATFSYTYNPQISGQQGLTVTATVTCNLTAAAEIAPLYKVVSILYDPPGNDSSNGFADGVTGGDTSSITNNFGTSDSVSFTQTDKTPGNFTMTHGVTIGWGQTEGDSQSFSSTLTVTSGNQLHSTSQNIDHTQDQIFVLLNPAVYLYKTGPNSALYTPSFYLTSGEQVYGDVMNSNVYAFQNPSQMGTLYLEPQQLAFGTYPGFEHICANALPPAQCTDANACGCLPSDFATIVAQDPMVGINQTVAPTSVNNNRFVSLGQSLTLEGPQQSGSGPVTESYSIDDSNMQSTTESQKQDYSVGFVSGFGWNSPTFLGFGTGFSINNKQSFEWSQTQSSGIFNGLSHTAQVILGSTNVGCLEYANVYEDTVYHTFVFDLQSAPPSPCQ